MDLDSARFHINEIEEGNMVYIENESCIYVKDGDDFRRLEGGIDVKMTQYDLNKNIYSQMEIPEESKIREQAKIIDEFEANDSNSRKMLLCRELNYYTVFEAYENIDVEFETLKDAVLACATDWGQILDIQQAKEAVEIWIKLRENGEAVVMYLFNCENMFVGYRG